MSSSIQASASGSVSFHSLGNTKIRIYGFYLGLLGLIYCAITFYYAMKNGYPLFKSLAIMSYILLLFLLMLVFLPLAWIIRKKYAVAMIIDKERRTISINYTNKQRIDLEMDDIAFVRYPNTAYDVLILYDKIIATRGHLLYAETADLLGFALPCGWTKAQIAEIAHTLKENRVEEYKGPTKSFLDRVFL